MIQQHRIDNTWSVAALTARSETRYWLRNAISVDLTCIRGPHLVGSRHNIASAVSMWYYYISIDIDRYFTKYLDIDRYRYRYTRHCSQTEWCKDPVQHLPVPLPAINCLQKVFTFVLNVVFH